MKRFSMLSGLAALMVAELCSCISKTDLRGPLPHVTAIQSAEFRQASGALLTATYVPGNKITTLNNGDQIFPSMLQAIRGAKRSVNFETYIFHKGGIPETFVEALAERARAGVKVKALLDGHGASESFVYHKQLRDAGVELEIYHPLSFSELLSANHRTHRKLLVVDGRIGFIGGAGIADEWKGKGDSPDQWHDLHYRVEGPVVAQLQAAFNNNWLKTHHEVLQGPDYFPPLSTAGRVPAGAMFNFTHNGATPMELMCQLAIASAQKTLLIETPYFVPDKKLSQALCDAARRGVKVEIIMPGKWMDVKIVQRASRGWWKPLIKAGVHLYEFKPTMIHSKLLVADGLFVSVGSMNLDPRSRRINDEANLIALDAAFAREQTRIFQNDLKQSEPADLSVAEGIVETSLNAVQSPLEDEL